MTILREESEAFKVKRKYKSFTRNDEVNFSYNCGEKDFSISIDDLFEGNLTSEMIVDDLNEGSLHGFFEYSSFDFN